MFLIVACRVSLLPYVTLFIYLFVCCKIEKEDSFKHSCRVSLLPYVTLFIYLFVCCKIEKEDSFKHSEEPRQRGKEN